MTVSLLIMTLNEIDGMKHLMPKINHEWVDEIILVDGGSTDGTIEEAEKYGLKILKQKKKGHGAGILEGIESTNSDFIVIWSPDGNHEPEEIPLLIKKSQEGFDQVIISRFANGSINEDANLLENFGNRMFAFLANTFFGGNFTDSLNESRIISRKSFNELNFDALRMNSTQQLTIRGFKKNQKMAEIIGNEGKRIGGKKKMTPLKVGADLSANIIKEFVNW
tara:strand:- start:1850 stop:2515 length:666 start_codon:yes stop_codon:yes gene_type:complete